ncbi:RraA family protein [Conexibacter arvalis]|uniref:Putative 4-hydroxy-4-methyl-2-oxoglutarate aldolase n=1 Tax=Conexibacter arvalis TaxID=912552 RepID=A0A840IC47_9ACTN|nr:regulator of RNase E activity RraA [Conexibacter arvalis]
MSARQRTDGRDLEAVNRLAELGAALASDCLDRLGVTDMVMDARIRPLTPGFRVAGYAATVKVVAVDAPPADFSDAYKMEIAAVDALQPGDVMVVSESDGAAFWGELLASASRFRGAAGVVADSCARDANALIDMGFPSFVRGLDPRDSYGRVDVEEIAVPVDCGGVTVRPGDCVVADIDGVVVVPAERVAEVLALAEEKRATESTMRGELSTGLSMEAAFAKFKVL